MKLKTYFLSLVFIILVNVLSAQTLEMGGNFSTSNEAFYKNAFGADIGYIHNFKKQYIFFQFASISKDNSYSQVVNDAITWTQETPDNYYINKLMERYQLIR